MSVSYKPMGEGSDESNGNGVENGVPNGEPTNGNKVVDDTISNVSVESGDDRNPLAEAPSHSRQSSKKSRGRKSEQGANGQESTQSNRRKRRKNSGSLVLEPIRNAFRRLSQENLIDGHTGHSRRMSETYNEIVLQADTESPMFYGDYPTQNRSGGSDIHILILLMIIFCPIGGFVPLIMFILACREGDRRRRFKMRSQAVKIGKCILVFGVAFVIVTLIVVIVIVASIVSTRTDDSG